ncbi:leucyl/phenylalanyl-tRNA--protein transferase [Dulcicalothrix desertica PCC 7102]|uniref:Leucyl/phenylalanyl-tRNA--protein transferase n=1 Tax=Dulcicalothrix desertica PCC 7102 TaxID=232991 RepID=A0A433VAT6_9CYAN|nr:leucyl/phenylalanyl-tRNA--protein transferase [Dulcicalothrix desertica]RUT03173.1 leucyl/phenylalanyl-tRNA--protein transferase [Dulcicalothrix desertica PCC 7102]TWH53545.1 leucyl/phenylalanyl-tRNA--protein transferase [Dulcicalothrix desertica PCC 7102]
MQYDVDSIIHGYAQGYFLMADDDNHLGWYQSRDRTLIPLDERFRYPKSLRRVLNKDTFSVAINRNFPAVVEGCANRDTTWISDELKDVYLNLNQAGWAYSYETWLGSELAGGILGIVINGAFIGESMFFNIPDGSKVAMVKLVQHLQARSFVLFDAQMMNPHLERFGAYRIKDKEYQRLLEKALQANCSFLSQVGA